MQPGAFDSPGDPARHLPHLLRGRTVHSKNASQGGGDLHHPHLHDLHHGRGQQVYRGQEADELMLQVNKSLQKSLLNPVLSTFSEALVASLCVPDSHTSDAGLRTEVSRIKRSWPNGIKFVPGVESPHRPCEERAEADGCLAASNSPPCLGHTHH